MGNKNSGRRTKAEEIAAAIETITEEALLKLARSKVKEKLDRPLDFQQTKDIALPIVLKGMTQKVGGDKDNPLTFVPIYGGNSIQGYHGDEKDIQAQQAN